MSLLWTYADQQSIKPISPNKEQDWEQWAIEVQFNELKDMMGAEWYQDVVQNPTTTENAKLIAGGTYEISGVTYEFKGLKYVLSYLLYGVYIMEGQIQDTFSGMVFQNREESTRLSMGERKNMVSRMKSIALKHWKDVELFVCENSSDYPNASTKKSGRISYF